MTVFRIIFLFYTFFEEIIINVQAQYDSSLIDVMLIYSRAFF